MVPLRGDADGFISQSLILILGNPFPVVEERNEKNSLLGSPLKSGYQSHYVLTEISGTPVTRIDPSKNHHYDEIVVIQEAQVRHISSSICCIIVCDLNTGVDQSLDMKYVLNEIREIVSGKSEAVRIVLTIININDLLI